MQKSTDIPMEFLLINNTIETTNFKQTQVPKELIITSYNSLVIHQSSTNDMSNSMQLFSSSKKVKK